MKWSICLQYAVFDPFEARDDELKLFQLSYIRLFQDSSEENMVKLGSRRQRREVSV